ncbi:MAG: histidine phosphatase family protein [Chitinophagales bacterium]
MSVIYLVRHGQASIGSSNYDNLSERGKEQAEILGRSFRKRVAAINEIQVGNLTRHSQTLEFFRSKYRTTANVSHHDCWNEYDHVEIIQRFKPSYKRRWYMIADMTRKLNPKRDFMLMFEQAMQRWMSGEYDDDYTETWRDFQNKCNDGLNQLIEKVGEDGTAIVFTSGGIISAITQRQLNLPDEYFMQFNKRFVNCGVTKIISTKNGSFVSTINDYSHFELDRKLITYI